jgi:predicted O-linked N-acetylglucosamine transferase (SPINDLY family)
MSKAFPILQRAVTLHQSGQLSQARTLYQQALRLDARNADGRYLLALLECQDGNPAKALPALRRLALEQPRNGDIHFTLGRALHAAGDPKAAAAAYAVVMATAPANPDGFLEAARCYSALRDWRRAAQVLESGLAVHPAHPLLWNGWGVVAGAEKRDDEAASAFRRATAVDPNEPELRYAYGRGLRALNRTEEAATQLQRALQLDPGFVRARMLLARLLPVIYDTPAQVGAWRRRITETMEALPATAPADPATLSATFEAIADTTNFYLAYQGHDDRAIAERWGSFVHTVVAARHPDLTKPPARSRRPGKRIRIGFRSAHLRDHTVLYLFRSWLTSLDRTRFEVRVYGEGEGDAVTRLLAAEVEHYRTLPDDVVKAAQQLRADALDVLVHLDIGMDPAGQILGSMRLAPVQAVTWGHPVTTGLQAIDWFLSADAMEPEDADEHYSERLLRLPGLAVSVTPPTLPAQSADRDRLGLSESDVAFFCAQSLYKLLPQHDDVWPRIAARVPNARFVFLASSGKEVVAGFKRRLDRAFAAQGLSADHHVVWSPPMDRSDYLALNMACDIFLDSLEWSGGRTTLEAVACGLVPITTPGLFMRGRHTAGILAELDLHELVAADKHALVDLAVRLATDADFRIEMQRRLAQRRGALFSDTRWRPALEQWIEAAVQAKRGG